jgi:hypothetical protein
MTYAAASPFPSIPGDCPSWARKVAKPAILMTAAYEKRMMKNKLTTAGAVFIKDIMATFLIR